MVTLRSTVAKVALPKSPTRVGASFYLALIEQCTVGREPSEGLFSELQEVRDFLKSEGERVQREVANYAQLNQSALAAIKINTDTIGPWKSTARDSDPQNSGTGAAPPVCGLRAPSPAGGQTR